MVSTDAVEEDDEVAVELWRHVVAGEDVGPGLSIFLTAPAAGGERGISRVVIAERGGLHTEDNLRELVADDIGMEGDGGLDELDAARRADGEGEEEGVTTTKRRVCKRRGRGNG
jgi:hypothetical protein